MKKITLALMLAAMLTPLVMKADYTNAGYYRLRCVNTNRCISIKGTSYSTSTDPDAFWHCIKMRNHGKGSYINPYDTDSADICDPGTVIYIPQIGSSSKFHGQGTGTYEITSMTFKVATVSGVIVNGCKTYYASKFMVFYTAYLQDYCGFDIGKNDPADNKFGQWLIEPLSEDSIDKYYFAVDPLDTPDNDGYYWATLTCDFPCKIPTDGSIVGAYTVTSANIAKNNEGIYYLTDMTPAYAPGSTIPGATPVLLKCKSKYASDNKLIPSGDYIGNTSFPISNELLKGNYFGPYTNPNDKYSWKAEGYYIPDEATKKTDNYLSLMINDNGEVCLGNDTITYMQYNTAWLDVSTVDGTPTMVMMTKPYDYTSLADALAGKADSLYHISDGLYVVEATDADKTLWCTDGNDNWVKVVSDDYETLKSSTWLTPKSVHGKLSDLDTNPVLTLSETPKSSSDYSFSDFTTYAMTSNFSDVKADEVAFFTGFYFVEEGTPKLRGYSGNGKGTKGQSLVLDLTYVSDQEMTQGSSYTVLCAVQINEPWDDSASAPKRVRKGDGSSYFTNYKAYPLSINAGITAVNEAVAEGEVANVTYFNALGVQSAEPFAGVNIVVTTYTDGTRNVSKVIK